MMMMKKTRNSEVAHGAAHVGDHGPQLGLCALET